MCGRYTFRASAHDLSEWFDVPAGGPVEPRYNIAPTQPVLIVRTSRERPAREAAHVMWGLVPSWADDPSMGSRMINARSETAAEKPAFRHAFRRRRCLVPADGFYEWKKVGGGNGNKAGPRQPYHIIVDDGAIFAFAGLWEHWQDDQGNELETCAILTTQANEKMSQIHERMPVILHREDYDAWLDHSTEDADRAAALLRPFEAERLRLLPVSTYVNSPRHEDERCVAVVEEGESDGPVAGEDEGEQGLLFG